MVGSAGVATTLPSDSSAMPRTLKRVARPAAVVDRTHQVQEHLFALAAHDGVDPRRLLQHLRVHEGAVDAAEHA